MNPRFAVDFDPVTTAASRSALLELARSLKHCADALVKPFRTRSMVAGALDVTTDKFHFPRSEGPVWYPECLAGEPAAQEAARQRTFQLAAELGRLLL